MTTFDACIAQLEALLERENAALCRMDVEAVSALTVEKTRLVNLLRDFRLDADKRPQLAERSPALASLTRTTSENKVLLERAMLVQRRMMAIVAAASQAPSTGYGQAGAPATSRMRNACAMIAQA